MELHADLMCCWYKCDESQTFCKRLRSIWQEDPWGKASKRSRSTWPVSLFWRTRWATLAEEVGPVKPLGRLTSGITDRNDSGSSACTWNTWELKAASWVNLVDPLQAPLPSASSSLEWEILPDWWGAEWSFALSRYLVDAPCWRVCNTHLHMLFNSGQSCLFFFAAQAQSFKTRNCPLPQSKH